MQHFVVVANSVLAQVALRRKCPSKLQSGDVSVSLRLVIRLYGNDIGKVRHAA